LRAVLLYHDNRRDEAFREVERALVHAPLDAEAWLVLAEGYLYSGRRRSASDILQSLSRDEALPHDLWSPLFDALCRVGLWHAALAVSRRAAQRRPDDDLAYFSMAHASLRGKQPVSRAIHLLERAIDLNPREARYRVTLAVQLLGVGRRQAAYDCLAALEPAAVESLTCRCCLERFLRLVIERGDAQRAALLAGRLAQLTQATLKSGDGDEPS
jgi:tetratricopeptide (TPR) repeat protein